MDFILLCAVALVSCLCLFIFIFVLLDTLGAPPYITFVLAGVFLCIVTCVEVTVLSSRAMDMEALYTQFEESKEEYSLLLKDDTLSDAEKNNIYDKAKEADENLKTLKEGIEYNSLFVPKTLIEAINNETYILDDLADSETEEHTEETSHVGRGG